MMLRYLFDPNLYSHHRRLTNNFANARVDGAFSGTDREVIEMATFLRRHEGIFVGLSRNSLTHSPLWYHHLLWLTCHLINFLFVGPSSALNVIGAVKLARKLGFVCKFAPKRYLHQFWSHVVRLVVMQTRTHRNCCNRQRRRAIYVKDVRPRLDRWEGLVAETHRGHITRLGRVDIQAVSKVWIPTVFNK